MENDRKVNVQGFDISAFGAVIIGCGGLGTHIAAHLAGAGIGRLLLYDDDVVQLRNLNRQFFYTPQDVGQPKHLVLAKRLRAYAPSCDVRSIGKAVRSAEDLAEAASYDILLIAVDNVETRKVIQSYCRAGGKPCVNGGVNAFFGTAYLYVPLQTPDLEAAGALQAENRHTLSPGTTVGIIGALQAKLAVDHLCGDTSSQGMLLCYDGTEIQAMKIREGSL